MKIDQQNFPIDERSFAETAMAAVHLFGAFQWTWHEDKIPPTYNDIVAHLSKLTEDIYELGVEASCSGRLRAEIECGDDDSLGRVYFSIVP